MAEGIESAAELRRSAASTGRATFSRPLTVDAMSAVLANTAIDTGERVGSLEPASPGA